MDKHTLALMWGRLRKTINPVLPWHLPAEANLETWKIKGISLTRRFVQYAQYAHQTTTDASVLRWGKRLVHQSSSDQQRPPPKRITLDLSFSFLKGPLLASQGTLHRPTAFPPSSCSKYKKCKGLAIIYRWSFLSFYRWEKQPGDGKPEMTKEGTYRHRLHQDSFLLQQTDMLQICLSSLKWPL